MIRAFAIALTAALSVVLFGCSSDEPTDPVRSGPNVSITPKKAEISAGGTQQFAAEVSGAGDSSVLWSVESKNGGTIDASGRYTAPAVPGSYRIVATSVSDPAARGTATVLVSDDTTGPKIAVNIDPAEVELEAGGKQQFTAVVTGTDDTRVTWSVSETGGGTVTEEGLYSAPEARGTYTLLATSVADPTKFASARIGVDEQPTPVVVVVEPAVVELLVGQTVQFNATVTGTTFDDVEWSVAERGGGTITDDGLYTAPLAAGNFTVVATSTADPTRSATARVVVTRPPDPIGLLPEDRMADWNPGLNSVGGIPPDDDSERPASVYLPAGNPYGGYSIDPALDGQDATDEIQAAVDAAADQASATSRRIVLLPSGTFRVSNRDGIEMKSYVTIRGQGSRGPNATRVVKPNDTVGPAVTMGQLWVQVGGHVKLAADVAHGERQLTVVSNPGYWVGEMVLISQTEDTVNVGSKWNPTHQSDHDVRGWYSRDNRPTGQVLEIVEIEGNRLTFSTPVRLPYLVGNDAELSRFTGWDSNGPAMDTYEWMGVENIYFRRGENGTVRFSGASYSWAKNVETEESFDGGVVFDWSFRCVLRDSFIHSTGWPEPGGAGYGLDVTRYSSDNLIENNIIWRFNKVMSFRASGGGNVVGYNYVEDGYGGSYPQIPEVGLNASHYATPHHELFEGNLTWNISGDSYWGNSIYMTFLRNHVTGRRRSIPPLRLTDEVERRFVDVPEWHIKYSFIGNVLGTAGMSASPQSGFVSENTPPWRFDPVPLWTIGPQNDSGLGGQDPRVAETTLRHGNYDFVNEEIVWNPEIERRDLPESLYLDRKPGFFGDRPWPWVTPDDSEAQIHSLPARERFDAMLDDISG